MRYFAADLVPGVYGRSDSQESIFVLKVHRQEDGNVTVVWKWLNSSSAWLASLRQEWTLNLGLKPESLFMDDDWHLDIQLLSAEPR